MPDEIKEYVPDEIDLKIINILCQNARARAKDIANEIFVSATTVAFRIERLEKNGIIKGYRVAIDNEKVGYAIKAFINLEVAPSGKQEFYKFIKECKNVVECNCVTGEYSMLIEVVFKSTTDLDIFIGELQQYGKTKTQIVFSTSVDHRNEFL